MTTTKNVFVFLAVFLFCFGAFCTEVYGDIHVANSCSYADVSAAITAASPGDTVTVPAGNCTWGSQLNITKGIRLVGPGRDNLTITSTYENYSNRSFPQCYLIYYHPSAPEDDVPFEISGFTFDMDDKCGFLYIANLDTTNWLTKIKIFDNQLDNGRRNFFSFKGTVYGVIYSNVINSGVDTYAIISPYGQNADSWNNLSFTYATSSNIYVEDNTIAWQQMVNDGGLGGRICLRFNTITFVGPNHGQNITDAHGNQINHATMGTEVYRNTVEMNNYNTTLFGHRGGMGICFDNTFTEVPSTVSINCVEEKNDNLTPPATGPTGQPQHVSDAYYFGNKKNGLYIPLTNHNIGATVDYGGEIGIVPQWNIDAWRHTDPFDGTSGVGVGTLASRPASCTAGVAYWATDQGSWNNGGWGGQGTLYKCTATDTWEEYYEPYTYPHPLRGEAQAMDYYVDKNHPSANDQNPGTIDQPWETITKANQTLKAGDNVYIRAGTYTSYISPSNSGTSGNRITYRNYGSETVTISGTAYGVYMDGKSYITIQGINFSSVASFGYIQNSSNYNIIAYCTFNQTSGSPSWSNALRFLYNSNYNWVHHCTLSNSGGCSGGSDIGGVLDIGWDTEQSIQSHNNLIEDSTLFNGGHHVLSIGGSNNVIRNNHIYNLDWISGVNGNRLIGVGGWAETGGRNLFEGNRLGYSDVPCDSWGVSGFLLSTWYNIVRRNSFFYNNLAGLELSCTAVYNSGPNYNAVYNNTFNDNGWQLDDGGDDPSRTQIYLGNWSGGAYGIEGNIFKNNLFYDAPRVFNYNGSVTSGDQVFANNYDGDTSGDPLFANATSTPGTPSDTTYPNLNLQVDSPANEAGGALTTVAVADTGTGTALIVDEAGYFQDGTFGPSGTSQADWIAVGIIDNIVQISSINYSTNTITLFNSISRNDTDSVWLYKKSDGVRVLYGSAPDAGAYEFIQDPAPLPPKNLRIIN